MQPLQRAFAGCPVAMLRAGLTGKNPGALLSPFCIWQMILSAAEEPTGQCTIAYYIVIIVIFIPSICAFLSISYVSFPSNLHSKPYMQRSKRTDRQSMLLEPACQSALLLQQGVAFTLKNYQT